MALRPDVFSLSLQLNSNLVQFERDQESTVLIKNIHEFAPWKAKNHIMCQSGQDSILSEEREREKNAVLNKPPGIHYWKFQSKTGTMGLNELFELSAKPVLLRILRAISGAPNTGCTLSSEKLKKENPPGLGHLQG